MHVKFLCEKVVLNSFILLCMIARLVTSMKQQFVMNILSPTGLILELHFHLTHCHWMDVLLLIAEGDFLVFNTVKL